MPASTPIVGATDYALYDKTITFADLNAMLRVRKTTGGLLENLTVLGCRDDVAAAAVPNFNNILADINLAENYGNWILRNIHFDGGSRQMLRINQPGDLGATFHISNISGHQAGACYALELAQIGPGGPYSTEYACTKYGVAFTDPDTRPYLQGGQNLVGFLGYRDEPRLLDIQAPTQTLVIDISHLTDAYTNGLGGSYRAFTNRDWWVRDSAGVVHDVVCTIGAAGATSVTLESNTTIAAGTATYSCYTSDEFVRNFVIDGTNFSGHPQTIGQGGTGISVYGSDGLHWKNPNGSSSHDYVSGMEWSLNGVVEGPEGVYGGNVFELTYLNRNMTILNAAVRCGTVPQGQLMDNINFNRASSVVHSINNSTTLGADPIMTRFNQYTNVRVNGTLYNPPLTHLLR